MTLYRNKEVHTCKLSSITLSCHYLNKEVHNCAVSCTEFEAFAGWEDAVRMNSDYHAG